MKVSPLAGTLAKKETLVDVQRLIKSYYSEKPDANVPEQRVCFGTSGHRGSSFNRSFNEAHIAAISQAICEYRFQKHIDGPLYLGMDTHALSLPALKTAVEVLSANGIQIMLAAEDEFTPTPVISHAILTYNQGRKEHLADGIVITPSHNPPSEGGFKYNPPLGGPADVHATKWIENRANELLANSLVGVKRISYEKALSASTTQRHDYLNSYVADLINVVDMEAIRDSKIALGVDPLGGAGVHYWKRIADVYNINLTIVNETIDPTFQFMTLDWDGQIRMDPSSPYAMRGLIELKDRFDVAFSCDTDHDRHGIVTKNSGLLQPNHYLSTCIEYLFKHRPNWNRSMQVGKTVVSSRMIDFVTEGLSHRLFEVPVGFKWFVDGLHDGTLGFVGEESAGGTFLRRDGTVWTTDKDGIIMGLLAGEIKARLGKDPGQAYEMLTKLYGNPLFDRIDAAASPKQKKILASLSPSQITSTQLAGEKIELILTKAPGNNEPIGGIKVSTKNGWFAARPSGTENIYKIYAESFKGKDHLNKIIEEAQSIVDKTLGESQ